MNYWNNLADEEQKLSQNYVPSRIGASGFTPGIELRLESSKETSPKLLLQSNEEIIPKKILQNKKAASKQKVPATVQPKPKNYGVIHVDCQIRGSSALASAG